MRFTPEDIILIKDWYLDYVPIEIIAKKVGHSWGVVRGKIFSMRLRRSGPAMQALRWAPEHLKSQFKNMTPDEFVDACYAWRNEQAQNARGLRAEAKQSRQIALMQECQVIDASHVLSRKEKIIAKRNLGMTLETIAQQYGITRERVRQINDPEYKLKARKYNRNYKRKRLGRELHPTKGRPLLKDDEVGVSFIRAKKPAVKLKPYGFVEK